MADIKLKKVATKTIKIIDKGATKTKDTVVSIKDKSNTMNKDNSTLDYGSNKINSTSEVVANESVNVAKKFNKKGKDAFIETKNNITKGKIKIKQFKKKLTEKNKVKGTVSKTKKTIKTAKKTVKNGQKVAKETLKTSQRAVKFAKESAKKTAQTVKVAVKATISAVKGIIAATKALIALLIAGGWVAVSIIIILFMAMMLFGSVFGIFFSSDSSVGGRSMSSVIEELNDELGDKIIDIQNKEVYDDYTISSTQAEWKEILAIYVAKVTLGKEDTEVITIDDDKIKVLKQIFWDMNNVSHTIETEIVSESIIDDFGNTTTQNVSKQILHIAISSKTLAEMETLYFFNLAQKEQVKELLKPEYDELWSSVILGGDISFDEMYLKDIFNVPYESGINFIITSGFGTRPDPFDKSITSFHNAIDSVPIGSKKVTASANGIVISVSPSVEGGNTIILEHNIMGTIYRTSYVHLKDNSIIVRKDETVVAGQIIAEYGNTGTRSKGAHLHFSVQKKDSETDKFVYVNPIYIFK